MKILDVGCGAAKTEGATGIDKRPLPVVDIVHDLNQFPWPIPDDQFDLILFTSSLEMLEDIVKTMEEVHRIG